MLLHVCYTLITYHPTATSQSPTMHSPPTATVECASRAPRSPVSVRKEKTGRMGWFAGRRGSRVSGPTTQRRFAWVACYMFVTHSLPWMVATSVNELVGSKAKKETIRTPNHCGSIRQSAFASGSTGSTRVSCSVSFLIGMETAVLDALEEVDEDLGRPVQWADGSWGVYCVSCEIIMGNVAQYRQHADYNPAHRRPESGAYEEEQEGHREMGGATKIAATRARAGAVRAAC